MEFDSFSSLFKLVSECGLNILADCEETSKKPNLNILKDLNVNRLFVCSILSEYIKSGKSHTNPVECVDVMGGTGIHGLLWKKFNGEKVNVTINDSSSYSCSLIKENASRNGLNIHAQCKDPTILLLERGFSFVYIDSFTESSYYFDAAFKNISRNSILVLTTKDDPSLQGAQSDVAYRRYAGRITRTTYSHELAIRLVVAAMARSAAKYNKALKVLCCYSFKGSFTIAVSVQRNPLLANSCLDSIRFLYHCLACEERRFQPFSNGFPIDEKDKQPECDCSKNSPSSTIVELGPIWACDLFHAEFIKGMTDHGFPSDSQLQSLLKLLLEESRCEGGSDGGGEAKRARLETCQPAFYYNVHRHHPQLPHQPALSLVISRLQQAGHRASRTHFSRTSLRTDANLKQLYHILSSLPI